MKFYYKLVFILNTLLLSANFVDAGSLEFVENQGQWEGNFLYRAMTGNEAMYLQRNAFTYVLGAAANEAYMSHPHHANAGILKFHAYRVVFENSNPDCRPEATKPQPYYYNYFLGNDQSKWKSEIYPTLTVNYPSLYQGVDMHVSTIGGQLKYEFVAAAGADISRIVMSYEGQDALTIKKGALVVKTSVGDMIEKPPYTYQVINGMRKEVRCEYKLNGTKLSFAFPKGYDKSLPLIIDPTLVFATFTGATMDNWGFTATYDNAGNMYSGGIALSYLGGTFPTSTGAFQTAFAGGTTAGVGQAHDAVIVKYNAAGTNIVYATFIGGSDNDQPHSMVVDNNNNLIFAGKTYSNNYPVTTGCYDNTHNGFADIVVTKFNANGTALIGSTYIGGSGNEGINYKVDTGGNLYHNYGDDARSEVIVDAQNEVYVTASTTSPDFPVLNATQSALAGGQDGVVFKLNPSLTSLLWSTYLGGTNDDAGYVLALDKDETHLYVSGGTQSGNFPSTTGVYQPTYGGGSADGFITRFLNSGSYPLQRATFIGKSNYDQCYGIQVDDANGVYAMGQTLGGSFPVTSGVYSNPGSSQFVIKLDSNLTTNIFSTVFGSGNNTATNISPVAFLVDTCQNIYISGWGGVIPGLNLPGTGTTTGMPTQNNGTNSFYQSTTDGRDFYFIVLGKNALSLLYASFMGGANAVPEHVDGGTSRFDKNGVVYQAICGGCGGTSNFPTTSGSYSPSNGSPNCNLLSVKMAFNLASVSAGATASPEARGCPPLTVNFTNSSSNAISYDWNFGDNTAGSTLATPTHTFNSPGIYSVRMIAINPNACKERDTTFLTITVDSTFIDANFTVLVTDSCGPFRISLTNNSTFNSPPGNQIYTWDYGDGTNFTGANPGGHTYSALGTYTVTLVMRDSVSCNKIDSISKTFTISSMEVSGAINFPDSICLGTSVSFSSIPANATTMLWRLGDGFTSPNAALNYTYTAAGTYTVTFVVTNPNSCNGADSVTKTIVVNPVPTAAFDYTPIIPQSNTPIDFTNRSSNADAYLWRFGDNTSSSEINPTHLYKTTGRFTVCLIATTVGGCFDTACKTVEADVRTLVDLPTAFSPNGDGVNDILYIEGAALETVHLEIYNRWGQLVFETKDVNLGWDGTYQGKEQPTEAYGYILEASFFDGTSTKKTGNITLVR